MHLEYLIHHVETFAVFIFFANTGDFERIDKCCRAAFNPSEVFTDLKDNGRDFLIGKHMLKAGHGWNTGRRVIRFTCYFDRSPQAFEDDLD